jgi:hypothetical protein
LMAIVIGKEFSRREFGFGIHRIRVWTPVVQSVPVAQIFKIIFVHLKFHR